MRYARCSRTSVSSALLPLDQVRNLYCCLNDTLIVLRIAVFCAWAPRLFDHYAIHMKSLLEHDPQLEPNFLGSVFACATFNFGPQTCTIDHRDCANLPFGWCAITALGDFNPITGGHLILWDLKLVIQFPPGSTVLIPSATLRHSNTRISSGEQRFSFTQYTAGGLFRWVDQGFQSSSVYYAHMDKASKEMASHEADAAWEKGLSMFSYLTELLDAVP